MPTAARRRPTKLVDTIFGTSGKRFLCPQFSWDRPLATKRVPALRRYLAVTIVLAVA